MTPKSVAKAMYVKELDSGCVVRRILRGIYLDVGDGDFVMYEAVSGKRGGPRIIWRIQLASWKRWLRGARMVK
jgi:hypothetical protein